jgi:hypothetical protein
VFLSLFLILQHKPDIVCTEKGVADLTQHYLAKAGISVLRRLRKTDNNRIARATGATICNVPEEVNEEDIGTRCGLFEVRKIGDEYFAFLEQCREPKACSILLRGASKDVLNEIERNLLDAMSVVRNIVFDPRIVPGGGATEMAIATVRRSHTTRTDLSLSSFHTLFHLCCLPSCLLCPVLACRLGKPDENLSCASYECLCGTVKKRVGPPPFIRVAPDFTPQRLPLSHFVSIFLSTSLWLYCRRLPFRCGAHVFDLCSCLCCSVLRCCAALLACST